MTHNIVLVEIYDVSLYIIYIHDFQCRINGKSSNYLLQVCAHAH